MSKTAGTVGILVSLALSTLGAGTVDAAESPGGASPSLGELCHIDLKGDKKDEWIRPPKAESSLTQHHFSAGGKTFDYTATAGTLILRDDEDKPIASMGYVAYTRRDLASSSARRPRIPTVAETVLPISTHLGGFLLRSDCLGALYGVSDPCASGLTFAPQALRPACPAVDPSVWHILTEDAFPVRAAP